MNEKEVECAPLPFRNDSDFHEYIAAGRLLQEELSKDPHKRERAELMEILIEYMVAKHRGEPVDESIPNMVAKKLSELTRLRCSAMKVSQDE